MPGGVGPIASPVGAFSGASSPVGASTPSVMPSPSIDLSGLSSATSNGTWGQDANAQSTDYGPINIHGADLSSTMPTFAGTPYPTGSAGGRANSPSIAMQMNQAASGQQPSQGGFWNGVGQFLAKPWEDMGNSAMDVYHHLAGGLQGGLSNVGANPNADPMGGVADFIAGAIRGLANPYQGATNFNNTAASDESQVHNPIARALVDFTLRSLGDPLTYAPVGVAVKPVAGALKLGLDAAKNIPAVSDALDHALAVSNTLSKPFKQGWQRYLATNASDNAQSVKAVQDIFKGTTPEERAAVTHIIEQAPGYMDLVHANPKLATIVDQVNALKDASGQSVFDRGLIPNLRENYMPHILSAKFDNGGIFANSTKPLKPYLSSSKQRQLEGTIQELNQRAASGEFNDMMTRLGLEPGSKLFEDDAAKLLTSHLLSNNKARALHDFIQNTVIPNATKITDIPAVIPEGQGIYRPDTLRFFPSLMADSHAAEDAVDGMVPLESLHNGMGVSANTPAYLMRNADANFLNGAFRNRPPSNMNPIAQALLRGASTAMGKTSNLARTAMLYNPATHLLNNVTWQTYLADPGALNPAGWMKYLDEAKNGAQAGSMYERAANAGAISSAHSGFHGGIHDIANQVAASLDRNPIASTLSKANPYTLSNAATWIPEHAIRANLFERAVNNGMSDAEAADFVNSYLGNHAGLSQGEQAVQKYVFPFYNWAKTSLGSNAKAAVTQTPKFTIPYHLADSVNRVATGHGMAENPPGKGLYVGLPGVTNKQGQQFYVEPYNPGIELAKLVEGAANGPQGVADYAYRRSNPVIKLLGALSTGEQDPTAAVGNKYNVVPYPDLPGGASNPLNDRPAFFGNTGPLVNPWLSYISQTFGNPVSDFGQMQKSTGPEIATRLLGDYGTYYNPQTTANEQKYQNTQQKSELRQAIKALAKYQAANGQ